VRIDLDFDSDDIRRIPRERVSHREAPRREIGPVSEPGPLDRRVERLKNQAQQKHFPDIPRRSYERKVVPKPELDREPAERHVRGRQHLQPTQLNLRLRPEEMRLLGEAGRFRVLALKDIATTIYDGDERGLRSDLRYLETHGLVSVDIVNARRDGRARPIERIEVVTLTNDGEKTTRLTNTFAPAQKLYHGLVKPREVEHDAQIYRAYLKEWNRIASEGGEKPRVILDFELKSQVQKAIYVARKSERERDLDDIKRQVAETYQLPFIDGQIQIPDVRIEYQLDQGSRTGFSDIEVVTAAYHPGHLRAKVQAGFRLYASHQDSASVSARIEDEHHLLDHVLDL
jgi:hypothetical protein